MQYCLNMDDYETLKAAGGEITALDTLVYVKSKSAAGYELDRTDVSDLRLASGYVIDDATNGIRENLETNIRVNSREEVLASLSVLDTFDSGDAASARGYLLGVRTEAYYSQQLETNSSLRDAELATYSDTRKLYYSEHSSYLLGVNGTGAIGAGGTVSAGGYYTTGTSDYGSYGTKGYGGYSGVVGGGTVEFTYIPSGDPNSLKGKTLSIGGSATIYGLNVGVQINQPLHDDHSINTELPRSITIEIGTKYTTLGIPCVLSAEGHTIINDTKIESYSSQ